VQKQPTEFLTATFMGRPAGIGLLLDSRHDVPCFPDSDPDVGTAGERTGPNKTTGGASGLSVKCKQE
jgi:hypothetical protein